MTRRLVLFSLCLASLCHAKSIYINNQTGDDANSGASAQAGGASGPVSTFAKAVTLLEPGDTLSIASTGAPYREVLRLDIAGTSEAPIVIEGNGAVIELGEDISVGPWTRDGDFWSIASEPYEPKQSAFAFYRGHPIVLPRAPLNPGETPPDFTLVNGDDGTIKIRFPEGLTPPFTGLYKPTGDKCVFLAGCKHLRIRNLNVRGAGNDGFGLHGPVEDVVVENCTAILCGDEGTSAHGDGQAEFRDCLFAWNGSFSGGVTDVHQTRTDYLRCISAFGRGPGFSLRGAQHKLIDSYALGNDLPEDKKSLPKGTVEMVNFVDITNPEKSLEEIKRLAPENPHMAQLLAWYITMQADGIPAR